MPLDTFVDEPDEDHLKASKYIKSALELAAIGGVWVLETIRAELVHPEVGYIGLLRRSAGSPQPDPLLSPEINSALYGLNNGSVAFWSLHMFLKRNLPDKLSTESSY